MEMESLINIFSTLEDPRDNRGKKHKLIHVIVLSIYGILCGYTDFVNMAYFLKKREELLTKELGLLNGIPSHDTFSNVFRIINPQEFMDLFITWVKTIANNNGLHIAIDGKAIKSATDKINGGGIPYIVSGFLCDVGLSIGQVKVEDKSNEITAIPDLLDLLDVKDATITIDAIGCQTKIVEKIREKEANYCLTVKDNQRGLCEDIRNYFIYALEDLNEKDTLSYFETIEKDHGRIDTRKYYVSNNLYYINDKDNWLDLRSIGMVIQNREINGTISKETHYYISNEVLDASKFSNYVRGHWQIENNLHWILDVFFDEDHSTSKKDKAIENISIIRKIAFNLTKLDIELAKKTTKKKIIDFTYDFDLFKKLIFETIPSKI